MNHVKINAQFIDSCNILRLKNYATIKSVNLKLKDVDYLKQSIDNYANLKQYNTDADELFAKTRRVVVLALKSVATTCVFDPNVSDGDKSDMLNQSLNFETFEIALKYLEECENNFTELDRSDQQFLLSAQASESNAVSLAEAKAAAQKHCEEQIRLYKKSVVDLTNKCKADMSPAVIQEGEDTPPPAPAAAGHPPAAMVRMNSITTTQMAFFNQAATDFKNIFTLLQFVEVKYPKVYQKLGGSQIKSNSITFFEQVK